MSGDDNWPPARNLLVGALRSQLTKLGIAFDKKDRRPKLVELYEANKPSPQDSPSGASKQHVSPVRDPDAIDQPENSVEPNKNVGSEKTVEPEKNVQPEQNVEPENDVGLEKNVEPENKVEPKKPGNQDNLIELGKAVEPLGAIDPERPIEPDRSACLERPAETGKPAAERTCEPACRGIKRSTGTKKSSKPPQRKRSNKPASQLTGSAKTSKKVDDTFQVTGRWQSPAKLNIEALKKILIRHNIPFEHKKNEKGKIGRDVLVPLYKQLTERVKSDQMDTIPEREDNADNPTDETLPSDDSNDSRIPATTSLPVGNTALPVGNTALPDSAANIQAPVQSDNPNIPLPSSDADNHAPAQPISSDIIPQGGSRRRKAELIDLDENDSESGEADLRRKRPRMDLAELPPKPPPICARPVWIVKRHLEKENALESNARKEAALESRQDIDLMDSDAPNSESPSRADLKVVPVEANAPKEATLESGQDINVMDSDAPNSESPSRADLEVVPVEDIDLIDWDEPNLESMPRTNTAPSRREIDWIDWDGQDSESIPRSNYGAASVSPPVSTRQVADNQQEVASDCREDTHMDESDGCTSKSLPEVKHGAVSVSELIPATLSTQQQTCSTSRLANKPDELVALSGQDICLVDWDGQNPASIKRRKADSTDLDENDSESGEADLHRKRPRLDLTELPPMTGIGPPKQPPICARPKWIVRRHPEKENARKAQQSQKSEDLAQPEIQLPQHLVHGITHQDNGPISEVNQAEGSIIPSEDKTNNLGPLIDFGSPEQVPTPLHVQTNNGVPQQPEEKTSQCPGVQLSDGLSAGPSHRPALSLEGLSHQHPAVQSNSLPARLVLPLDHPFEPLGLSTPPLNTSILPPLLGAAKNQSPVPDLIRSPTTEESLPQITPAEAQYESSPSPTPPPALPPQMQSSSQMNFSLDEQLERDTLSLREETAPASSNDHSNQPLEEIEIISGRGKRLNHDSEHEDPLSQAKRMRITTVRGPLPMPLNRPKPKRHIIITASDDEEEDDFNFCPEIDSQQVTGTGVNQHVGSPSAAQERSPPATRSAPAQTKSRWSKVPEQMTMGAIREDLNEYKVKWLKRERKPELVKRWKDLAFVQSELDRWRQANPAPSSHVPQNQTAQNQALPVNPELSNAAQQVNRVDDLIRLSPEPQTETNNPQSTSATFDSFRTPLPKRAAGTSSFHATGEWNADVFDAMHHGMDVDTPAPDSTTLSMIHALNSFSLTTREMSGNISSMARNMDNLTNSVLAIQTSVQRGSPRKASRRPTTSADTGADTDADMMYDEPAAAEEPDGPSNEMMSVIRQHVATLFGQAYDGKTFPPPATEEERRQWIITDLDLPNPESDYSADQADLDVAEDTMDLDVAVDTDTATDQGPGHEDASPQALRILRDMMRRAGLVSFRPDLGESFTSPENKFLWNFAVKTFIQLVRSNEYIRFPRALSTKELVHTMISKHVNGHLMKTYRESKLAAQIKAQREHMRRINTCLHKTREWRCDVIMKRPILAPILNLVEACCSDDETEEDEPHETLAINANRTRLIKRYVVKDLPWRHPRVKQIMMELDRLRAEEVGVDSVRIRRRPNNPETSPISAPEGHPIGIYHPDWIRTMSPQKIADLKYTLNLNVSNYLKLLQTL
ncbi:hypothetical protein PSTG_17228 [Puccinia striiformis f. sp. tritici PST-78]|uniref:Uncharacterized protein n=1 Tax=Puccinia striiformis f. sp. tritici PST-78 TaxID=1165861 RepID=A0A0L0URC0_9BASI|nr:hypothetical protein PSTG_17228 [Puccinia striiformis f. sp. tritici PST-78]